MAEATRDMPGKIAERLAALGVVLPPAPAAAANYVPFMVVGNLVFVSGQISAGPDGPIRGKLGADMTLAAGVTAARSCAVSLLAQLKAACGGDLERLKRVVKINGFVNCTAEFSEQHLVVNGASDFLVAALGEAGRHARAAVGVNALPLGGAVEIEAIFEVA